MKIPLLLVVIGACLAMGCRQSETPRGPTTPSPPTETARTRLLLVTHTTGFRHPSIATAEMVLTRLAADQRAFTITYCRDAADVARLITPAALAEIDVVLFANTTGNLGIADLPAFLAWIRAGHGFVGVHSASDTYHDAPDYLAMLAAAFDTHGDQARVDLRVEDPAHPAGAPLPSPWTVLDEIYEFRDNPRPRVNVLLSLDRHPPDGHAAAGQPGDFPLAWSHTYGSGRVFYTALGHREDVWLNPLFQAHLLGAIRWAFPP